MRVLIFESDPEFAAEVAAGFVERGAEVEVVEDGEAGILRAEAKPPDVILLAIELPRMNGFSVCNKLKRHKNLDRVPLLLLSRDATEETFEQHRRLRTRADDYIKKPITVAELLDRVSTFVKLPSAPALTSDPDVEVEAETAFEQLIVKAPSLPPSRPPSMPPPPSRPSAAPPRLSSVPPPVQAEELDDELDVVLEDESALENVESVMEDAASLRLIISDRPAPIEDSSERSNLEAEMEALKARVQELESSLSQAVEGEETWKGALRELQENKDRTIDQLSAEVADLTAKLSQKEKGASARDFLDLREQLNRKDKELLEYRDQISAKDRELIKLRDIGIQVDRENADLTDALKALETEKAAIEKERDAFALDKAQANKRADDFKAKSERLAEELEQRNAELKQTREQHENELIERDAEMSRLRDDHRKALEQAAEQAQLAQEKAVADAVAATREEAQRIKEEALRALEAEAREAQEAAVRSREAELRAEQDAKLAALHRAQEDALRKLRAEHAQILDEANLAAQNALAARENELREEAAQNLSAAEAAAQARYAELEEAKRASEAERDARLAQTRGELDARTEELETARRAIYELNGRISLLEAELASVRSENRDLAEKLENESRKVAHAHEKWQADQSALEQAKQALSQVLELIGSTETRTLL
jgi:CheY-like chemotaxis protein